LQIICNYICLQKMHHCSDLPDHYVKSQFHCTLTWLTMLFLFAFPHTSNSKGMQHIVFTIQYVKWWCIVTTYIEFKLLICNYRHWIKNGGCMQGKNCFCKKICAKRCDPWECRNFCVLVLLTLAPYIQGNKLQLFSVRKFMVHSHDPQKCRFFLFSKSGPMWQNR
jgi:hypothetical protein